MQKRAARLFVLLIALILALTACKAKEEAPAFSYGEGFEASLRLTGGAAAEEVNLKGVSFEADEGALSVSLSFLSGSRLSGTAAETALTEPPPYAVYMLENPYRLVAEFTGVSYWDYEREFSPLAHELLFGFFHTRFADEAKTLRLTFQLNEQAVYKVEPLSGGLRLTLKPVIAPKESDAAEDITQGKRFHAVANTYSEYCSGALPRTLGFDPALASDGETILMLSGAFYSEADAKNNISGLAMKNQGVVEAQWAVEALALGTPPRYDATRAYAPVYAEKVARVNGEPVSAEVFIADGLYLCSAPDRSASLYGKRLLGGRPGVDEYAYEKIYSIDARGGMKQYLDYEFHVVDQAAFSPDGRKLAVLERDEERTHLYIFDVYSRELITDLTEMGFGELVSAFTWDSLGFSIFAVSGSDSMQVHQYDFNVPQENKRHSIVDKTGADEGYLAYRDGELYFTHSDLTTGDWIYRIKPDGGVRKAFKEGGAFAFSPDGRYMAVSTTSISANESSFSLYDMESGKTTLITNEFTVNNFLFSRDGARLYYLENRLSGGGGEGATSNNEETAQSEEVREPYSYELWEYVLDSGNKRDLMSLPYPSIVVANKASALYLNYYDDETGGSVIRAAYALPIG